MTLLPKNAHGITQRPTLIGVGIVSILEGPKLARLTSIPGVCVCGGVLQNAHTHTHTHTHTHAAKCMQSCTCICRHTFIHLHPDMKIIKIKCKKQNKYIHVILLQVSEENEKSFWLSNFLKAIGLCIHLYRCIIKIKVIRNQIKTFISVRASEVSEEIFCPPPCAEKRGDIVFGFPSFNPPSGSRYFVYATPATVLLRFL